MKLRVIEVGFLILLLMADQVSKWWAQMHDLAIMNHGGVFGIMPTGWWGVILAIIWGLIAWEWWHMEEGVARWGMGLIVMGGLGNLIDRLLFGSVRDFIFYPGFNFYGNLADIFLGVGVVMVIAGKMVADCLSKERVSPK